MSTVDNLRKTARRWLNAIRAGDAEARARLTRAYPAAPSTPTLRDIQHALARERGHENWIALTRAASAGGRGLDPLPALLTAAGRGDAAEVTALLDAHPHLVNQRGTLPGNTGARTALHFGSGHEPIVRLLLERGADPNIRDDGDHAFPLHFAAERGDLAVVRLLVEHGADPIGAGTKHALNVLEWAVCFEGVLHLEVARYLLAHGARHTLLSAVAMGDPDAIRAAAAAGADLAQRMDDTNHRRTPVHLAVVKRQPHAVDTLIDLGAPLELEDAAGLTALDHAALLGDERTTTRLIDAGARLTLAAAIVLDRADDVARLVREHPDLVSAASHGAWTRVLGQAAARGSAQAIERLLQTLTRQFAGLSVINAAVDADTAVDRAAGYTPLHAAAFHGNAAAVEMLLKHGANPRARDGKYCGTPAGWAAYAGHRAIADRMLEAEIDIFDAIDFDRADRIADIVSRDPGALDRRFKAYAQCPARDGQWWPAPECTPLEWATAQAKPQAMRVLTDRGAGAQHDAGRERRARVATFLQAACWDHHVHGKQDHRVCDRAAARLLAQDPSIARDSLYTAIVCGEREEVARRLAANPDAARARGGPREWTPLLYLAYTRFTHAPTIARAVDIARLLLDHGADPNEFYMAYSARYSVLVGVAGEGEQDSPRQPYAADLFDLLLSRGAEPFDIQVLYNTHFSGDMLWWLELVHRHTIDTPRGAAWRDADWPMFDMGNYGCGARFIVETAIKTRQRALAEWALTHGANPDPPPARDPRFPKHSLYALATVEGLPEIADLLARRGALRTPPAFDDLERLTDACLRLDRAVAAALLAAHPELRQSPQPLFAAARRNRPDALALLRDLGFSLENADGTGKRALHEAAANDARQAAAWLIEQGAEVDPRESNYGAAPIGWAAHFDHRDMVALLSRHSRDIWILCFNGCVDRVRDVIAEDPAGARVRSRQGHTPLFWLPDAEDAAVQIVELLLAGGADPAATDRDGETAASIARRRGLTRVAERLEQSAAR